MRFVSVFTLVLAAGLAGTASAVRAEWRELDAGAFRLPPPPRDGSEADRKDLEILKRLQKTRTSEECKFGQKQSFPSAKVLFGPGTGVLSPAELRKTEGFLKDVLELTSSISKPFKEEFGRARPYERDSSIRPCARKPGSARTSYPSSHAAMGITGACALATVFPERAKELEKHGIRVGAIRAVVGVHHPSDVEAGQELGRQICRALTKDREFLREARSLRR